jgi:hypothetical protein
VNALPEQPLGREGGNRGVSTDIICAKNAAEQEQDDLRVALTVKKSDKDVVGCGQRESRKHKREDPLRRSARAKTWGQPLSAYYAISTRGLSTDTCNRFVVVCQIEPELKDCVHSHVMCNLMWRDDQIPITRATRHDLRIRQVHIVENSLTRIVMMLADE